MAEQREPGWFWVRVAGVWRSFQRTKHKSYPWSLQPDYMVNDGYWDEIGERIPSNEELKALWAVAEAARLFLINDPPIGTSINRAALADALARLGEQKMSGPEPEPEP